MKSLKIPMTIDEFYLAEFPFGWKDEYCDGFAYITPRSHGVLMKMPVNRKDFTIDAEIQNVGKAMFEDLTELFFQAFVESVEFCDYKRSEMKDAAVRNVKNFFDGERGIPQHHLCRIAVKAGKKPKLVGACLISKYKYGYKNEILFVHPKHQNQGIGTALVSSVLNELSEIGEEVFWSERHICNELSEKWHKKFGFSEVLDIVTARLRRSYLKNQVWRNEKLGNAQKLSEICPSLEKAEREVEILEKIEELNFREAWLSWKYDY